MNNSKLAIDHVPLSLETQVDNTQHFKKRESELIKIITALQGISSSEEWSSLKQLVFDQLVPSFERQLRSEAMKDRPDVLRLSNITGQLKWAERYADLSKLEQVYKVELNNVRKQLYGTTQEDS